MPGIVLNHREYRRHVWRRNVSDIAVPTLIHFMKHTPDHIKLPKDWNRRWWSVHFNLLRHETFNSSQTEIQRLSYSKLLGYNFDKGADSSSLRNVTHSDIISHQSEWPSSKNLETITVGEGVEKREHSCTAGGNVNWYSHYGEQYGGSLKNYK